MEEKDSDDVLQIGSSRQQSAQIEFENASRKMISSMKSMEDQMQLMKNSYSALLERHNKLQSDYTADKEKWKIFRDWWQEKMENKKQLSQSFTPANRKIVRDANREDCSSEKRASTDPQSRVYAIKSNNRDPTMENSEITNSEARILKDVGLPLRSQFNGRRITDIMPTPSRNSHFLDSSSPANDRLKRTEKIAKRSRLPEGSTRSPSDPILTVKREPLRETTNANSTSSPGPSFLNKTASVEKNSRPKTINQEFEINPEMNGNVSYLHKDVVRSKIKRKQMHAYDCECCRDFYDAVGPVAVRPFEDVRKADLYHEDDEDENIQSKVQSTKESARKRQEHLQKTSRHRDYGPPPSTPQGYWEIEYPDTQTVAQINRSADAADRKRREEMENDPRFRRRET